MGARRAGFSGRVSPHGPWQKMQVLSRGTCGDIQPKPWEGLCHIFTVWKPLWGLLPWTPPKWVKVILWLLKAVLRAGRECGVTGKYGHHWDVGGNGISVLQGLCPEVFRGGGSGAYGHGMLRGDVSPSGFDLGVAESRVPPLTPRHFAARTSLPPSTRVVHAM